jgi:hypothetical protein
MLGGSIPSRQLQKTIRNVAVSAVDLRFTDPKKTIKGANQHITVTSNLRVVLSRNPRRLEHIYYLKSQIIFSLLLVYMPSIYNPPIAIVYGCLD